MSRGYLLAVEPLGDRDVLHFRREERASSTFPDRREFSPWFVTVDNAPPTATGQVAELRLAGTSVFAVKRCFGTATAWAEALDILRTRGTPVINFGSRTEQYLVESGITLFQGMPFQELVRAQVDIETLGLDPNEPENAIIIIAVALNGRHATTWDARHLDEPELIQSLCTWIKKHDPDVLEGHNLFNFDLPFLMRRAARYGLTLDWGRDGSSVRPGRTQRFKAGARSIPYEAAYVRGRHIIDTYQQVQRYDISGQLESYGLKSVIADLGLERDDRTHVLGDEIARVWTSDPTRMAQYAIDDVIDTNLLSELTLPTEYYQTQILPSSLQATATGGPGEKVNDLMVRAYLSAGESIPSPDQPRSYPGGFAAVRATGVFGPVVNADVQSLYPSIMLKHRIAPKSDHLAVFLPMLGSLTERRLEAKAESERQQGSDQPTWHGIQASLKVLINSFYGYLGYSRGYFSDFDAAEQVTVEGHRVIQQIEDLLTSRGATIIEIDTDGLYFVPPAGWKSPSRIHKLVTDVGAVLESGIHLALGGVWHRMLSLKLKNYALLSEAGDLTIRGSSLRSRRDESFVRDFIRAAILGYLDTSNQPHPREVYLATAEAIMDQALSVEQIARAESITERTFSSPSNRRLARVAAGERIGERLRVFQRYDGSLARIEDYAGDEDRAYLLQRLRQAAERFRPMYEDPERFDFDFPVVTVSTDISALRATERTRQTELF